jgi:uncharacterized protein with LGFP repeats
MARIAAAETGWEAGPLGYPTSDEYAEAGPLGYPTSDEYAVPGGRRTDFQHGSISWDAATSSSTVTVQ